MRATNLLLMGALSALIFTGCTDNDDNSTWSGQGDIVFSSHIESLSTRVANNAWTDGDAVGIFMTTDAAEFQNKQYLAKADGTLTAATGNALRYPESGTAGFIAYYPYDASLSGKTVAVSVADQTDPSKIDLLYSNNATAIASGAPVSLAFTHRLSQIVLNIGSDETIESTAGLKIALSGMNTQADFNLADGTLTAKDSKATINLNVNADGTVAEAIVLPTAALTGAKMTFTLGDKIFEWDVTVADGTGFEGGYKYTYTATLSTSTGQPAVSMGQATITGWGDKAGGDINVDFSEGGTVEPEPGEGIVVTADAPYVALTDGQGDFTINNVVPVEGLDNVWTWDATYKYMMAKAYSGGPKASESWLVSPAIDLSQITTATLTFSHKLGYGSSPETNNTLWIMEVGAIENWQQLIISNYSATNWAEVNTSIDLQSYIGKTVKFGFKYTSSTEAASTWEVYNFKVAANGGGTVEPEPEPEPEPTPGANLLTNPGFEDWTGTLPTGWNDEKYNTGEIVKETTIKHSGEYSLRQTSTNSTNKIQQVVNVTGGKKYRLSYWFLDNDTKASSRYWFAIVGSDGKTINDLNSEIQQSDYPADNTEWQQVKIEITMPAAAAQLRFEARTYRDMTTGEAGGYIYYDDMELVEIE